MRIAIFILSFLLPVFIMAQPIVNRSSNVLTVQDSRLSAKLNLYVPRYQDTTQANLSANIGIDTCGAQIFTYADNSFWFRSCSPKQWVKLLKTGDVSSAIWGSITGTLSNQTDLQNALNLKLNISDTANMLLNYLRKVDTTAMLGGYLRKVDSFAMLANYITTAGFGTVKVGKSLGWDTTVASANYWRIGGNINGSARNFGTLDAQPIIFIGGGAERMRMEARGVLGIGGTPNGFIQRGLYVVDTSFLLAAINLTNSTTTFTGFSQASNVVSYKANNQTISTMNNAASLWQTHRVLNLTSGGFHFHTTQVQPQPSASSTAIMGGIRSGFNYATGADTATFGPRLNGFYISFESDSTSFQVGGYRHVPNGFIAFHNHGGNNFFNASFGKTAFGLPKWWGNNVPYGVFINRTLGIRADSIPIIATISDGYLAVSDPSDNQLKRMLPANLGFPTTSDVANQIHDSLSFAVTVTRSPLQLLEGAGSDPDTLAIVGLNGLGTAGQSIRVNSGATALEYYTPSATAQNYIFQFSNTQAVTVANTSAETTIYGTGEGAAGIDGTANITAGTRIVLKGSGSISTDAVVDNDIAFNFDVGTTTLGTNITGLAVGLSGVYYEYEYVLISVSTGTNQDAIYQLRMYIDNNLTPLYRTFTGRHSASFTTTGTVTTNVTVDWVVADAENSVQSNFNTVEIFKK